MFSAQLRLPGNLTTAEKSQKVDDVIEELVRPHFPTCDAMRLS